MIRFVAHHRTLVCHNAHVPPVDAGVAGEQRASVAFLVLGPRLRIHNACQHLAHVVGLLAAIGHQTVDFFSVEGRRFRLVAGETETVLRSHMAHNVADRVERLFVRLALVVGYARDFGVRCGTAQHIRFDLFANGGLHEERSGQEDRSGAVYDEGFIAHDGQIGASRHATAHDGRNLRDAFAGEDRVVAKDAPEVLLVGKDLVLHRQIYACRIHQVDDGHVVFERDLLGTQVLLRGDRKPGPGFHGGVVRHDQAEASAHVAQPHDRAARGASAFIFVHLVSGKLPDFGEVVGIV